MDCDELEGKLRAVLVDLDDLTKASDHTPAEGLFSDAVPPKGYPEDAIDGPAEAESDQPASSTTDQGRASGGGRQTLVRMGTIPGLLLIGVLAGWASSPFLSEEPPVAAAMMQPTPSPSSPTTAGAPPTPRPTTAPSPMPTRAATATTVVTPVSPALPPTHAPALTPTPAALTDWISPTVARDPTPVISGSLPIPAPVAAVPVAPDAINIAVLGSDRRADWTEWHTDAIHIISIQTDGAVVSVISIPRDLYVYIPGFWMSRVNFADYYGDAYGYEGGGTALLRDTLMYNLGIRVDYAVRTDFDGLIGVVDLLGGIDVPVHCRLSDNWPYADENGEYPILTLEPGVHHLDGETALWYARSRLTTNVLSRERRQQQVLQAIWHRLRDTNTIGHIPALWEQTQEMMQTDLDLAAVLALAQIAFSVEDANVRFYNIGWSMLEPWTTPQGGSVFLPLWEEIEPVMTEAMAPVPETRLARAYTTVEVWNGTQDADREWLAADLLGRAGFSAVVGAPDRRDYGQTQLIVFGQYDKGLGVDYLQAIFGVSDDQVVYRPDESSAFDLRLILGADYQTCPN